MAKACLKPDPKTDYKLRVINSLPLTSGKIGAIAIFLKPVHTNVRCKLAANFISQAQAQFYIRQSRSNPGIGIILAVEIHFDLWC